RDVFARAAALFRAEAGEDHPDYAGCLNNLATAYRDLGDVARARVLYAQGLRRARGLDPLHLLNNPARTHHHPGDYHRASFLLRRARDEGTRRLGERHREMARVLINLAIVEHNRGRLALAADLAGRAVAGQRRHLDDTFAALSERQRLPVLAQYRF